MPNQVSLGEDGIIYNNIEGDQTEETVLENQRLLLDAIRQVKEKNLRSLVLISLENAGKQDSKARAASTQTLKLKYDRLAAFGAKPLIKHIASLVIFASGLGEKAKYFNTKEEALNWLNSYEKPNN